jgi:DUF2934 family protein
MQRAKWNGDPRKLHDLSIRPVAGDELQTKMHDAVAWRAYHLFELRGCVPGHETEDWARAEAEVLGPLTCGSVEQDHRVCLTVDTSCFDEGPIELWLEPRRLTLCGFDPNHKPFPVPPGQPARPRRDLIFRVHHFAVDLDPGGVKARFNGPALDIYLAKAGTRVEAHAMAAAG